MLFKVLLDICLQLFADFIDVLLFGGDALNPAGVVPNHILVEHLADGDDLLVDMVHLKVLVDSQVDLYLLDCIDPLVKHMLGFVDFSESSLPDDANFFEETLIPVLLKVLAELIVVSLLLVPENYGLMQVLACRLVLLDPDEADYWLRIIVDFDLAAPFFLLLLLNFDCVGQFEFRSLTSICLH